MEHVTIPNAVGATISSANGMQTDSESITVWTDKGVLSMKHYQDCCESVLVEDVVGDPDDLIGARILEVRESSKHEESGYCSTTWTFYHIITDKADITIRWIGTSNGYYSESVSCEWTSN